MNRLLRLIGILLVIVPLHEAGHFVVARLLGFDVIRVSFGFGPVIAEFADVFWGSPFAVSLVPLGAYVMLSPGSLEGATNFDIVLFSAAGSVVNVLLGTALLFAGASLTGNENSCFAWLGRDSIAVAFLNILPLGPLDGTKVLFGLLAMAGVPLAPWFVAAVFWVTFVILAVYVIASWFW